MGDGESLSGRGNVTIVRSLPAKIAFIATIVITVFIVVFHLFAFVMESLAINSGFARSLFSDELVDNCAAIAKNQGVYNLMLAIGLALAAYFYITAKRYSIETIKLIYMSMAYFFISVAVVGLAGGATFSTLLFVDQMLPGILGFITRKKQKN